MAYILIYLLFIVGIFTADAQTSARKFVVQFLRVYSPNHAYLLQKYYQTNSIVNLPGATINIGRHLDFMIYLTDTTYREIIIHEIPLMVHEIYHDYSRRGAYMYLEANPQQFQVGKEYLLFYFDDKLSVFVDVIESFPAYEMARAIPKHLQQERFKIFIDTKNLAMLPQKMGFVGLLDEWNAFYHQTLAAYESKEYYERESFHEGKHWEDYFSNYYECYHAYVELKYYILKYLQYAKYNYPKVYEQITEHTTLKTIYKEIDNRFKELLRSFDTYKPLVMNFLQKKKISTTEEIHNGCTILFIGGVGVDTQDNIFKLYEKALEDEELKDLDFRLKN